MSAMSLTSDSEQTLSSVDLPNLPGLKRSSVNPTMQKLYLSSKPSTAQTTPLEDPFFISEYEQDRFQNSSSQLMESASRILELNRTLTPYKSDTYSFNNISGRYSLKSQNQDRIQKTKSLPFIDVNSAPLFVTDDRRRTFRFKAYFEESVPENLACPTRAREVQILFYINDNTIEVLENQANNTGLIEGKGKFLKRHQIHKPVAIASEMLLPVTTPNLSSQIYLIEDFYSGAQVNFYNTIYTIIDCDGLTRKFFDEVLGRPFGDALDTPTTFYRPITRSVHTPRKATIAPTSKVADLNFFQNDRKVLRFFGVWDNRRELFGDKILVEVHYFLAENKVEIVPIHGHFLENTGRDKLPKYFKKTPLFKQLPGGHLQSLHRDHSSSSFLSDHTDSKNELGNGDSSSSHQNHTNSLILHRLSRTEAVDNMLKIGEIPNLNSKSINRRKIQSLESSSSSSRTLDGIEVLVPLAKTIPASTSAAVVELSETSESFLWSNFLIGSKIIVAGIQVLLTDADKFTRSYFLEQGMPLGAPTVLASEEDKFMERAKTSLIRPLTGEADALASKNSFLHIPPPKDGVKAKLFQGVILRYQARMITENLPDVHRKFILQFFLEDDSLSIQEPPRRNSGHSGGPFLSRDRIGNPKEHRYYLPRDFYIGAEILILGKIFILDEADDYTIKYMESNSNQWRFSNLKYVLSKLKTRESVIRNVVLTTPRLATKLVSCSELENILKDVGFSDLVKQEVTTIFRSCQDRVFSSTESLVPSQFAIAGAPREADLPVNSVGGNATIKLSKILKLLEGYNE